MLLKEFIYFDQENIEMRTNDRYDPSEDTSVINLHDTRKSRLTLRELNRLRKAGDAREREQKIELELVQKMYKAPPAPGPGM
jgi:hypothetical protein